MNAPPSSRIAPGWEPSFAFTAGSPVPKGVCEYDVMGAVRGALAAVSLEQLSRVAQ